MRDRQSRRTFDWDAFVARRRRQRIWGMAVMAVVLPAILAVFYLLFQNRHYMLVSLLILGVLFGGFLVPFERRVPRAREIVLLAAMISFCVAANEICNHTIPIHAGTTMVVIAGIALGPETGFLIGALSRLLCNFFAGQGPWTPWQMIAWGLIGFLAGLVFNKIEVRDKLSTPDKVSLAEKLSIKKSASFRMVAAPVLCILVAWLTAYILYLFTGHGEGDSFFGWRLYAFGIAGLAAGCVIQRKKLSVDLVTTTVFTFVVVFLIYGGIMNFAAMLTANGIDGENAPVSIQTLKILYLTGVPYDAAHAGGAAFCMFLFGDRMLERLQRIQIKFGITLN